MTASPWYLLPNIASLTALVTIVGWFVTSFLTKRREEATQKIEREVKYLERQISEFYGPFFNLINQVVIMNHVQFSLLEGAGSAGRVSPHDRTKIIDYFQTRYFFPLHEQVNQILKDKLYLVDGSSLPEVVYTYLRSVSQERVQAELWKEFEIDTSYLRGIPYPNELYSTIKAGLDAAMIRYASYSELLSSASKSAKSRIGTKKESAKASVMDDREQSR
ncbi:hypothetical protein H7849_23820 [Alloacidobacterium dinghuense]|uniref:Uncharacterized protein n=1 Tax=Alloacidobacterium dinghuense TaxID=2763107 RepID=A0A7G8BHI4_9BACT|nr:hypothetical protein [Alloacidobacterium dinghuense]QNI32004.1 hypothetical protein H7849_23820 [Alloacidobacterium dinghuense]